MIGGGPDYARWPKAPNGRSFYWEGLNKGKQSIAIDLSRPEGRELAIDLATAPGANCGILLTNFPSSSFLSYETLIKKRADAIVLRVVGRPDGGSAVDYTVNCAVGLPSITGPASLGDTPVNHVLPAWDITTGAYAAFCLLAAERQRQATSKGREVQISLSDVAMSTLGHLGHIADVTTSGADRPRIGNNLFGAFGRDFVSRDGQRIMLVAITPKQWIALVDALCLGQKIAELEKSLGVSFNADEGSRFEHRDKLNDIIEAAVAQRTSADLTSALNKLGACWGTYRSLKQALAEDPDFSAQNSVFTSIEHPSGHEYLTAGAAATFKGLPRGVPAPAHCLGADTERVLSEHLRLSNAQIGKLFDQRIVAGPVSRQ